MQRRQPRQQVSLEECSSQSIVPSKADPAVVGPFTVLPSSPTNSSPPIQLPTTSVTKKDFQNNGPVFPPMQLLSVIAADVEKIDDMDTSTLHDVDPYATSDANNNLTVPIHSQEQPKGNTVSSFPSSSLRSLPNSKGSGVK